MVINAALAGAVEDASRKGLKASLHKEQALTWSKERIKEEIADLRRYISEFNENIRELESEMDSEWAGIQNGLSPHARSSNPEKHLDAMGDRVAALCNVVTQVELDIEFLKPLLDSSEEEKAEIAVKLREQQQKEEAERKRRLQEQTQERKQQERTFTKPIPRGRPGVGVKDTGDYIYRARAGLDRNGKRRWAKILGCLLFIGLTIGLVIWAFITSPTLKSDNSYLGEKRLFSREWEIPTVQQ